MLVIVGKWDQQIITRISVASAGPADPFLNTWRGTEVTTSPDAEEIADRDNTTTMAVDYSHRETTAPKYARIYLTDAAGTKLNSWDTSLLEVTYNGIAATQGGSSNTNGVYVSDANGINFDNLSVTLKAGAGNFKNYKVVTILSNDAITGAQEPAWDEQYTYSYTYPIVVEEREEMLSDEVIANQSVKLTKTDYLTFFDKSAGQFASSWYARWYVVNAQGVKQNIASSENTGNTWVVTHYQNNEGSWPTDRWKVADNMVWSDNTGNDESAEWFIQQTFFNNTRIAAPNGTKLADYEGYKIIFEITDENTPDHTIKLRYIFSIPAPPHFKYDGLIANTANITQDLPSRTATSVSLDWTDMTASPVKYARFFVVDANGDAVDPTDAAHQLTTVSGGTLCEDPLDGYYVYTGSNITTMPAVTLSSTDDLLNYKVVCWIATTEDQIVKDGTTVTEEPVISHEFIYSFVKPAVTETIAKTGTISWSNTSMTADASTTDIATDWGTSWGELSQGYYVKWTVLDAGGTPVALTAGSSRQSGWTFNQSAYTVSGTEAVLTGQGDFTAANWNDSWGKPLLYAPASASFSDVSGYTVVCEVAASSTATPFVSYTFTLTKEFLGELKSTATSDEETIELEYEATTATIPLGNALTAFSGTPKYVRVWLTTTDGTPVEPSDKLTTRLTGITHATEYGFFTYDETSIAALADATLTLDAGSYVGYQVHVALSTDLPNSPADFARNGGPRRAPADAYEPDYDFVYTFNFTYPCERIRLNKIADSQLDDNSVPLNIWGEILEKFNKADAAAFFSSASYTKWYIEDANGNRQPLIYNSNAENGIWTTTKNNQSTGTVANNEFYWKSADGWNQWYHFVGQLDFKTPSGTTLEDFRGYRFICEVSDEFDGTNAVPKVIFWIPIPDYFVGTLKTGTPVEETVIVEEDTKTYTLTELQTQYEAFVTSKSVTDADQVYLRLYAANVNGTLATDQSVYTFTDLPTDFAKIDQGWAYLGSALTAEQITALAGATVSSTQNLYDTGRKVGFIMAKAPFDERFYPTDAATVEAIINEPKWDYQYLLRFDQFLTTDGPDMIEETVTVRPGNADNDGRHTFNIAEIAALSAAAKGFDAKYMRWYLADSNGNIINPQTWVHDAGAAGTRWLIDNVTPATGMTHDNEVNRASDNALQYGQMWWYTDDNTVEFDDLSFRVTTPTYTGYYGNTQHYDLQNYQVVVYLSDNDDESMLTETVTTGPGPAGTTTVVTKEPTPDYKIIIKFNSFFGDLAGDANQFEQTFRQEASAWDEECATDAREYVISFDYAAKTVTMAKAGGSDTMTKNMSDQEYAFWSTFTNNTGTVPGDRNFYFRWFLRNKATGQVAQIQNSIVTADGGAALQDVRQYTVQNQGQQWEYYQFVADQAPGSKYYTNWISEDHKELGQLLRVKIDGSPTGSNDCFNITDYDLVLLLSADDQGQGAWANPWVMTWPWTQEGNRYCLVREPETFDLQYTFHFTTDFEADNIDDPNLKTKYKILIYDPVTRSATPTITSNYHEMAGDMQVGRNELSEKGYVRWYLINKATGEPISMESLTAQVPYTSLGNQYGYYRYKFDAGNLKDAGQYFHGYDPTITLPEGVRYQDVRIVAVFTTLTEPQDEPNQNLPKDLPAREPRQMQVKYIYDLVLEETLRDHWPFTHYHGIHYPLYHRSFEDSREFIGPGQPQDLPAENTAYVNQRVWDYFKNGLYDPADNSYEAGRTYNHGDHNPDPASPDYTTRNIRQKTHTKEYNYYLLLEDGEQETLKLPFQNYLGDGSDTEPMGYIRWYDWKTDLNSEYITPSQPSGTELTRLISHVGTTEIDRGWYRIMSTPNPTKDKVGVDFVAPAGFSEMTDEIVIACDVSRYMDGLDDSKQYLVHEPTLSIRYIYHILPAKVLAQKMVAERDRYFTPVMNTLTDTPGTETLQFSDIENYDKAFHLLEYNGRTVVSVVGSGDPSTPAQGNFSLRTTLTELDHYYVEVGGELKPCNNLQWYAYYEYEGKLFRRKVPMVKQAGDWTVASSADKYNPDGADYHREDVRLAVFEVKDFWGEYERVRDTNEKMTFHIQPGQFLHLVGCLGYDDGAGNITEVPTVSTELYLVDAAPKQLGSEGIERTDYTLSSQYKKAAELNFDDFFDDPATRYDKPLTSFDNYAKIPMLFADAQYGFCYPRLYGQCATDYMIHNFGQWQAYGFAPLHGDYTLLKSMNMPGVSISRDISYDDAINKQSMYALWYNSTSLYDVTHERANQKNVTDTQDYGAFLYVDAAEQSRTIGRLEFDAQLCAGAEIYYTAYIADMTDAITTPQVRFRVYTYNTRSGYPMGTVVGDEYLEGYTSSATVPVISFLTGDIATEGATEKGHWYQVYGYCNLPAENRAFLEGDQRHFYVEVDNYCENTNGADYAVDQITFYTNSARVRIAQASDVCDDEKGVKLRITALASALLPHFGQGQDREIFYRIYPYSDDPNKVGLEADEAITGQGVYCHEHAVEDGDRGNLYGAVPFHVGYNDQATYESNYDQTLYDSLEALLEAKKDQAEYLPKYGFYKDGDEVYYLLDERYFELTAGQEYFVSLYTLGSYKPGGLDGWGNPYGNHTCTAYSNLIMPRTMFIELTEDSEVSEGVVDMGCGHTTATKDFGVRVRYPLESGGYQEYNGLPFDFFLGSKSDMDLAYLKDEHGDPVLEDYTDENGQPAQRRIRLKDALEHFRSLTDGGSYKYPGAYTEVPPSYESEDEHNGYYYQLLVEYVETKKLLRLEATSKFTNTFTLAPGTTEVVDVAYLALPLYPQIDEDKEICSPITMIFHLDPTGGAPLMELGFDDVKYPESYKKRGVRVGLEQLAKMRDEGYMLHIPISNYYDKKKKEDPNALYFEDAVLKLSNTNDPEYLDADGDITQEATQLIVTTIVEPGTDGSSNEEDDGMGVFVSNKRMYLPLSFAQETEHPEKYVKFKEGYWYEVTTRYHDPAADEEDYEDGQKCFADLFIVFKVVPEFATWDAQPIGSTHLYNVSWHNDLNWKRSVRSDLYKDPNQEGRTQNTNTAGHPAGYDNDGEGSLSMLTDNEVRATNYEKNQNPGFVPMKFTYVTLLTGNHAPSLINEARTTGSVQTGGYLIDPNRTELMTDTSPVDNKESSKATDDIRYDMLVRYGTHAQGGEGCFGHRSKTKVDGKWGWRDDRRTDMTSFNENHNVFDVEKFYGNICKEIYFKPEAELLRQQRLTYEKAWVEKELVANKWYLAASPLKATYAGDMYVPTSMNDLSIETPAEKPGRQMTEAFQPISFNQTAVSVTDGTATSTPAYSRTKYPIYQRSWRTDGSQVYTKQNDMRANDYSANLNYTSVSTDFLEWSHTYNDVQVPYSTATTYGDGNTISKVSVPMGFSVRANRKVQKIGDDDVPALLRLPKADETYQYYDWSDTGSNPAGGEQTVSKPQAQLTNSINGAEWNYEEPMQYRFITDDASKESSTQGAMEFNISDLQSQDDYVLVGNPVVSSLNMGEFFNGNPNLSFNSGTPTGDGTANYSYWTYEGGQAKAFLVDKTTVTHTVTIDGNVEEDKEITYAITSDGTDVVGTIRPLQAFFVKKGTADKIYFTRNMSIDGNFPVNNGTSSGTGNGDGGTGVEPGTDGGSRPFGVTLRAATSQGGSSATVRLKADTDGDYREGEDVETLFDSNLADVPMVYTVAGGQAVSIDQRPQLDLVSFGVVQAKDEPVEVTVTTQHASPTTQQLYFIDALTGEQTPLADGSRVTVQPNDYGRYFISATTGVQSKTDIEHGIVISVRQQEVTVTANGGQLKMVRATSLNGITAYNGDAGLSTQCRFQLPKGVYIIQASTDDGTQRQLKVVVE